MCLQAQFYFPILPQEQKQDGAQNLMLFDIGSQYINRYYCRFGSSGTIILCLLHTPLQYGSNTVAIR